MSEDATASQGLGEPRPERRGAAAMAWLGGADRQPVLASAMSRELAAWYPALARDPGVYCAILRVGAGRKGDTSAGVHPGEAAAEPGLHRQALADELRLCWRAECFSKPGVALIDGVVSGAALGLTLYGTHRVAGEAYRVELPETMLGGVPACGLSYTLARLPHSLGLYLALTGAPVGRADAYRLGFATHCIDGAEFASIEARLADADPVDPLLDVRHVEPGEGPLLAEAARIGRYFGAPTLTEILARLGVAGARDHDWAATVLEGLRARPPLALALADRAIRYAARLDIRQALIQDYRVGWRLVDGRDPRAGREGASEGGAPVPMGPAARVEDVPAELVDAYFEPLGDAELDLPVRALMQAARA